MKAQYLLRFDDLCPTMDRARWERFLPLIHRFALAPILSIVPDNLDPDLDRGLLDAGFWREMQVLEAAGATIGLHGYRHLCAATGSGVLVTAKHSEFAGVS